MGSVRLDLDEDLVSLLKEESDQPLERAALEMIVLQLYRRRTLSSGKAAALLGMPRGDFIVYASGVGIPFIDMTEEEWAAELQAARDLARRLSSSPTRVR